MSGCMELAIQKDCENLIQSFVKRKNPKFECFVQQWKASMFHRIYMAQSLVTEIIQSTNACFHYAKRILLYNSVLPRIGAIYLLYAIYFKQPTEQFVKIDIDHATWVRLKEFIKTLEQVPHTEDARCVYWELVKEEAFRFVASDNYCGLENLVNLDKIQSISFDLSNTLYQFRNETKSLNCQWGLVSGIEKLQEGYDEMKEIMNKNAKEGQSHNVMPIMTCFPELKAAFSSLNSFIDSHCAESKRRPKKVSRKFVGAKNKTICNSKSEPI